MSLDNVETLAEEIGKMCNLIEAMKIANENPRPYFVRDYDPYFQDKIVEAFGYAKTEKADKWWDRTNVIIANIWAIKHDLDRLMNYMEEHKKVLPVVPPYSEE